MSKRKKNVRQDENRPKSRQTTAHKRAKSELRASKQRLPSYLDHAGDAIYVLDRHSGRILAANKQAVEMLGYSLGDLLKMSASEIESVHPAGTIHAVHERTLREVVQVEGIHRRKDGSTFPVEIRPCRHQRPSGDKPGTLAPWRAGS